MQFRLNLEPRRWLKGVNEIRSTAFSQITNLFRSRQILKERVGGLGGDGRAFDGMRFTTEMDHWPLAGVQAQPFRSLRCDEREQIGHFIITAGHGCLKVNRDVMLDSAERSGSRFDPHPNPLQDGEGIPGFSRSCKDSTFFSLNFGPAMFSNGGIHRRTFMAKKDPRIDQYISKAGDFAKPVLKHLRKLVHAGCPDVEETMKWSFPHFMHGGILCSMASFKNHCSFGFWKGSLILKQKAGEDAEGMGQFGKITSLADLPEDATLLKYIREAVRLNDENVKVPERSKPKEKRELVVPPFFTSAVKSNKKALEAFEKFSPSHKREYVEWITEAKTEATRQKRLAAALEWMAEGKPRHWKYANC